MVMDFDQFFYTFVTLDLLTFMLMKALGIR